MSQDLVLITGGSSGIGKQLAADYLARGALVVIVADQVERLAAAEASLRKVSASVFSVACDIGDRQAVLHMSEVVTQTYGCPDILINNAGFATYRTFEASSSDELERLIEVNLLGAMRCTKAFLPQMIARRHGAIANMAVSTQ